MSVFLPGGQNPLSRFINLNAGLPRIPTRINFDYFFDRELVKRSLDQMTYKALYRGGSVVMQIARRSIEKRGMARPKLKVMTDNPDMSLRSLIVMTAGNKRTQNKLRQRLLEIQTKPPSAPGTPPHTHTGIFRRDIVYAYDPTSESVVIGQHMDGGAWLASLHEFGGSEEMQGWAWIPKWPRSYRAGIIGYWRVGTHPKNVRRWEPTRFRETFRYPARPYMRPAIKRAIETRDILKQFENRFRVGGF
jgi:hypothetical protein